MDLTRPSEEEILAGDALLQAASTSLRKVGKKLADLTNATCQINLVRSCAHPNQRNTKRLVLDDELGLEFKEQLRNTLSFATDYLKGALSVTLKEFDFQPVQHGEIAVFPLERFDQVQDWYAQFPALEKTAEFRADDPHAGSLKFTDAVLTWAPGGERIRLFKKAGDARLLQKKGGVTAFLTGTSVFNALDPGNVFHFDTSADFLILDELVYVLNYKPFEAILNFREITRTVARALCENVFKLLPVSDEAGLLKALMNGARYPNKLASIHLKPHLPRLDMVRIGSVIAQRKLPIKIVKIAGVDTIYVDANNHDHIAAYLRVLADDYVRSQITDIDYIALLKDV